MQAKKHFGQNFITDQNLIHKIVDLVPVDKNQPGLVIEIGPGKGALTKELIKRFPKVIAIEVDSDMTDYLAKSIPSPNLELLTADVLKIDFVDLIQKYANQDQPVYLISNLPYYITSPILFQVFAASPHLKKAIFMMQEEVARRLTAEKNTSNYNNLSVAASFYADKKYEFIVKNHFFHPQPKVDSAVISLSFKDQFLKEVEQPEKFIAFVRQMFNQRRKTIVNNLGNYLNDKNQAKQIIEQLKLNPQLRPENLGLEDFLKIFNLIKEEK